MVSPQERVKMSSWCLRCCYVDAFPNLKNAILDTVVLHIPTYLHGGFGGHDMIKNATRREILCPLLEARHG